MELNKIISYEGKQPLALFLTVVFVLGITVSLSDSSFSLGNQSESEVLDHDSKDFAKRLINESIEENEDSKCEYGSGSVSNNLQRSNQVKYTPDSNHLKKFENEHFAYFQIPKYILFHHLKLDLTV